MRQYINLSSNDQVFPYLIEFSKGSTKQVISENEYTIKWAKNNNTIHLFESDVTHYRNNNELYSASTISNMSSEHISNETYISKIIVYLPAHSISAYKKNIKYAVSVNTWINGLKIDLGAYIFNPTDTLAIQTGPIKNGNHEYHEYIEFDIIDPFNLIYSDDWADFRHSVCGEPLEINSISPSLQVSLHAVELTDNLNNLYTVQKNHTGGYTNFIIDDNIERIKLGISINYEPFGINFKLSFNENYDWFLSYLRETYNIYDVSHNDISYELILKSKDSVLLGPTITHNESVNNVSRYEVNNVMSYNHIRNTSNTTRRGVCEFFNSWNNFEEGWSLVGSLMILQDDYEIFSITSNEIPVTQEIFSLFYGEGSEKIIDTDDMNITQYNVVNKIENTIVTLERQNESKANVVQPVFFRANDAELLTLHPMVTENISINCNDYKSKVNKFILMIENCKFEQIGSNKYGVLFKIPANTLPATAVSGTYYLLDENLELITTGKYNCIR